VVNSGAQSIAITSYYPLRIVNAQRIESSLTHTNLALIYGSTIA